MINKMSNALLKATSGSFTKVLMTYVIATTILGQFVPSIIATFVMVTPMVKNTCEKMNISPSKMMFPVAIASVSCSFLVIPIGPYAADYVMYNGYLESYGWYDTAFYNLDRHPCSGDNRHLHYPGLRISCPQASA